MTAFRTPRRSAPYPWLKPGIFIGALAPLVAMGWQAINNELGANPIAEVENQLGLSALVFLLATVACTPVKRLFGWTWAMRVRRELGLFAFFYAALHFLTYLVLDQFFDFGAILADIVKRPFITVGFTAFLLLIPLTITSTKASVRQLGYRRWSQLHWLIYPAAVLASIHFIWRVKLDARQPVTYAIILAALLATRVAFWLRKRYGLGEALT